MLGKVRKKMVHLIKEKLNEFSKNWTLIAQNENGSWLFHLILADKMSLKALQKAVFSEFHTFAKIETQFISYSIFRMFRITSKSNFVKHETYDKTNQNNEND